MMRCRTCGVEFPRGPRERQSVYVQRVRCSVACRPLKDPDKAGRLRAEALYPIEEPCEVCGKTGKGRGVIDRHHRDSDRLNNDRSNIAFLCRRHHQAAHRLTDGKVGGGRRPRVNALQRARAEERAQHARRLLEAGMSIAEVGDQLGAHPASVYRWLRKYSRGVVAVRVSLLVPPATDR